MSKISVKGVLVGGVVDVISSVFLGLPFAIYAMANVGFSHTPSEHASAAAAATAFIHSNAALYIGQLTVGLACSVLGGYVAAGLAKHDELLNGALSSFLCVTLGIYGMVTGKDSNPLWAQVLLLLASPAVATFGGYLRRRQAQIRLQLA